MAVSASQQQCCETLLCPLPPTEVYRFIMREADIPFTTVQRIDCISLWLGSIIYGCHVVVLAACFHILPSRRSVRGLHKRLLYINAASFVFATAQIVIAFLFVFLVLSFTQEGSSLLPAVNAYNVLNILTDTLNPITNIIADSLLIWRCYVIWGRKLLVVAFPIIFLVVGTVCGYILVYAEATTYWIRIHAPPTELSPPPLYLRLEDLTQYMIIGYYASSLATNLLMSALIAYRILVAARGLRTYCDKGQKQIYTRIASIIIETGAIYSVCLLLAFILRGPVPVAAGWIFSTLVTMCASIFPALFTLLVSLNMMTEDGAQWTTDHPTVLPLEFVRPQTSDGGRGVADHVIDIGLSHMSRSASSGGIGLQIDVMRKV